MGRPTTYTKEMGEAICERIANGEPLRQICRESGVAWRTVYHWLADNPDFSARFARAREVGYDAIAEQCLEIADDGAFDAVEGEDGVLRTNSEVIQRSKLRVETRLKLLAKWSPKKYGDKLDLNHSGDIGFKTMSDDDLDRAIADALSKAGIAASVAGEGEAGGAP